MSYQYLREKKLQVKCLLQHVQDVFFYKTSVLILNLWSLNKDQQFLSNLSEHKDTNLLNCSADFRSAVWLFLCPMAAWLPNRGFWSHTGTRWSSAGGGACGTGSAGARDWIIEDTGLSGSRGSRWGGSASRLTSAALKALARTSSSALILTSREAGPSPDLQTTRCCFIHHSEGGRHILTGTHHLLRCYDSWVFPYPDMWPASLLLPALLSWQSALRRSRCSGLLTPIPVFRISDCTLYSLIKVFMPGTWVTRT